MSFRIGILALLVAFAVAVDVLLAPLAILALFHVVFSASDRSAAAS